MDALFPNGLTIYLQGGLLVGLGLAWIYLTLGEKVGASSFLSSTLTWFTTLTAEAGTRRWRLAFALGTVLGACLYALGSGEVFTTAVQPWRLALGGLLVGYGSRLSSGCTSGHGLCGLATLTPASLMAVAVFMAVAILTAQTAMAMGIRP